MTPWTVAHQAPLSMGTLQARILHWVVMPSSRGSSQPRDGTQVSHIAGRFFTVWPPGKPKNTGKGNLFLLQGSPALQEILNRLNYQGNPEVYILKVYSEAAKLGTLSSGDQTFWRFSKSCSSFLKIWKSYKLPLTL